MGRAKCVKAVSDRPEEYPDSYSYDAGKETLLVGDGEFAPVARSVWEFQVSGFRVISSWLGYRMARKEGKQSSPLDEIQPEKWTPSFTTELLGLLWILEHSLDAYRTQAKLLDQVLSSDLFKAPELPMPTDKERELLATEGGYGKEVGQQVLGQ